MSASQGLWVLGLELGHCSDRPFQHQEIALCNPPDHPVRESSVLPFRPDAHAEASEGWGEALAWLRVVVDFSSDLRPRQV